ncbi:Holliday junction branch migration protein RuvA [Actinomycetospora sp. TBRC 11914]|uniref:Holliday junction branch migration protein RuvA n=1 Tax=Actinomycetospora sp. TBRC 11914 TaxID=2729387 RepID=UPI00145CF6D1|nr:Holliday junction branch migration protein RuvA [Actinomycetospora sp. TBRC 11914]NMO93770.1 Holliday junction branch migration protein RuvA [Actinomycetospora sp. TBRC 11914]
MISSVRGEVLSVGLDHAVVEVGGVGMAVQATPTTLAGLRRGQHARLDTALVVREDSLTLFGFADAAERELFGLLQTVTGVGPRLALATLAVLDPAALSRALADGNLTTLMSVPGIGRKGAERLVVELRDKVAPPDSASPDTADPGTAAPSVVAGGTMRDQVVEALVGLGFAVKPAEKAVDETVGDLGEGAGSSAVLRAALHRLGPHR